MKEALNEVFDISDIEEKVKKVGINIVGSLALVGLVLMELEIDFEV